MLMDNYVNQHTLSGRFRPTHERFEELSRIKTRKPGFYQHNKSGPMKAKSDAETSASLPCARKIAIETDVQGTLSTHRAFSAFYFRA